ncbi:MAG: PAS domain S-box protein, partial [Verrucomicrobiia bacterium]
AADTPLFTNRPVTPMALWSAFAYLFTSVAIVLASNAEAIASTVNTWFLADTRTGARRFAWGLLWIFSILAMLIGTGGWVYLRWQQTSARATAQNQLKAIGDLKVQQIASWRSRLLTDGAFVSQSWIAEREVPAYFRDSETPEAKAEILHWLASIKDNIACRQIFLFDAQRNLRLSEPQWNGPPGAPDQVLAAKAMQTGRVFLSDLHCDPDDKAIHIDLVIPISPPVLSSTAVPSPVGALVMRMNAADYLFPLIESWPTPSHTAETLLVRRESNDVLYLSELRHRRGTALNLRLPIDAEKRLPAAMAVLGNAGVVEGNDYRGVPVVGAVRDVPGSPWFMVAKMDQDEIYAPLYRQAWLTLVAWGLLLAAAAMAMWLLEQRGELLSERQLSALAKHLAAVMQQANDIILLADEDYRIVDANQRAVETYGWSLAELKQKKVPDLRATEDWALFEPQVSEASSTGRIIEAVHRRKDGTTFPIESSMRWVTIDGQKFLQDIVRDITARKQAEAQLHLQTTALESAANGIVITNRDGEIQWANSAFSTLTGYSIAEVIGKNPRFLKSGKQDTASYKNLWDTILAGNAWHGELVNKRKDGSLYTEQMMITPVRDAEGVINHFIAIKQDVSQQRLLEGELRRAMKMEAVGRLAGGVAHKFNNLLQVILGYTKVLMSQSEVPAAAHGHLDQIFRTGERAAALTREMLALGAKQVLVPEVFDLGASITGMTDKLRRLMGSDIEMNLSIGTQRCFVKADPGQIRQVVINLCINARDAMPRGGKLTIRIQRMMLVEPLLDESLSLPAGEYVLLAVSDSGRGITPEAKARLFEPFDTADLTGKESSLVLAACYGIVKQSGGEIGVHSELGKGTTFNVYLPYNTNQE